ncbi:MAG: beta galactosidase jelly roll domain-containing protein, partial [Phycisphaeraceae bacterium]|nr:beta galactosidase jelly roll domain-containing protein [Phycisphaeraceae bacterium]
YLELAKVTEFMHPGHQKVGFGLSFYHNIFNPKIVRAARGFLNQAIAIGSQKDIYRERLNMVDMSQRYLEAYLDGYWQSQDHQYEAAVKAFDRMDQVITEMLQAKFLAPGEAKQRSKTMRMKALAEHFPKELGFFTDWKLLGPFDNSDRNAARYRNAFEPINAIGNPVVFKDGTKASWRIYKSPGGFLNLENALADRKGNQTISYAFAGTTYDSKRKMRVQLRMSSFYPSVVYVNGKQVFSRLGNNADCPDKNQVEVLMNKGKNTIVFKLSQTKANADSFPWGVYARVVTDGPDTIVPAEKWSFKTDPEDVGTKQKWFASTFDDSQWQRITVPQVWEKSIGAYDGYAWYRTKIKVPATFKDKAMEINFAGVDEQAWVYFNGTYLGERTTASTKKTADAIWNQPFKLIISPDRIKYGSENLLVVRVHDSKYAGGIYFPVRLRPAR